MTPPRDTGWQGDEPDRNCAGCGQRVTLKQSVWFQRFHDGRTDIQDVAHALSSSEGVVIPPAALERGEQAFVNVLRRRHPDASFVLRDLPVTPDDADVSGQVAGSATGNLYAGKEAGQDLPTLHRSEAAPQLRERSSDRNTSQAGR